MELYSDMMDARLNQRRLVICEFTGICQLTEQLLTITLEMAKKQLKV